MSNSADLVAAFLAKGGKVSKVETGATSGITSRDFYEASKGNVTSRNAQFIKEDENALIEKRIRVAGGVQNGLGEWISHDRLG